MRSARCLLEANADFDPGSERVTRPPATFFSINAVLAKLDGQRGRGPDAVRLASLTPSNVATDARARAERSAAGGKEPFGLFTFRAPEGMLWRKWRGIEADIAREQRSGPLPRPMRKAARPTPRSSCA